MRTVYQTNSNRTQKTKAQALARDYFMTNERFHLYKILAFVASAIIFFATIQSSALDINGAGDRTGVVALYLFDETGGTVANDEITAGGRLNLTLSSSAAVLGNGYLQFIASSAARSLTPATKIIDQCRVSNELSIEAYIESETENNLSLAEYGPARIVTLSQGVTLNNGFFLGQGYNAGFFYNVAMNATQTVGMNRLVLTGPTLTTDPSDPQVVRPRNLQRIVFTKDSAGVSRLYVTDENNVPILRSRPTTLTAPFAGWNSNLQLAVGNEVLFDAPNLPLLRPALPNTGERTREVKDWRGKVHMLAIYCQALTEQRILGARAPTNWAASEQAYTIDPNLVITEERRLAQIIYRRLVGSNIAIDHPILAAMEAQLVGRITDPAARLAAARLATQQPGFYNRTVKDFAKKLSNREHEVSVPLNDFSAMVIGATRDNRDARDLLRADFSYRADTTRTAVPANLINDILSSNRHYESLEVQNYDLSSVLIPVNTQYLYNGRGGTVSGANYDTAGLLTSRAFQLAHGIAGTNRRLVEFAFQEFLCRPITQWADNTAPDSFVGRDVDRFPTGEHTKYQTSCRGCHGQMDGLRGAFARLTFETGFLKHALVVDPITPLPNPDEANNNTIMSTMNQVPRGISGKYNKNNNVFPEARETTDANWVNYAVTGINGDYFGWRRPAPSTAPINGSGVREFGNMLAESQAYPNCLTEKVFRAVCKRDALPSDAAFISRVAASFKTDDAYQLRRLFERMAVQPECIGQ